MRRYVLYVGSAEQIKDAKRALRSIAKETDKQKPDDSLIYINHKSLNGLELAICFISKLTKVTEYLRHTPVDLLIFDERKNSVSAIEAIDQLEQDMSFLARQWGCDFHFPMKRMTVILDNNKDVGAKTFQLGRHQIKDILIAPHSLTQILSWLSDILLQYADAKQTKIGIAYTGGGIEGFLFQVGCSYALEQALDNKSLSQFDIFSGVSSGSIVASILSFGIPLEEILLSFSGRSSLFPRFTAKMIYDFAGKQIASRFFKQTFRFKTKDSIALTERFLRSIPTGVCGGKAVYNYLQKGVEQISPSTQFKDLKKQLIIGATHQDTFEHVVFGLSPWDDICVLEAVRASCALVPIFTPWEIKGEKFIDGQITRNGNVDLLVKQGCGLIFIIDPMIPYGQPHEKEVDDQGGAYTLIQSIKTLIHTRFRNYLNYLSEKYPDVDFIILQPQDSCAYEMRGSPMKYKINSNIVQLAYQMTLQKLQDRYDVYSAKLAKFDHLLLPAHTLHEKQNLDLDL